MPLLNLPRRVRAMREEFELLGGGFDEEAIEKASEFDHSLAKIHVVVDGIKGAIAKGLLPVLSYVADKAAAIDGWFVRMTKNTNLMRNALIVLGAAITPLAYEFAAAFAPVLLAGAALAGIVILVDDIVTMFEGGQSVIGDVIDDIFGKGQSADAVTEVKNAWVEVKQAFVDMWPAVKQVYEAMKWIVEHAADIGGIIGDKASQFANSVDEATGTGRFANMKRGRGGLTYEQNVAREQAGRMIDAQNRGENFQLSEVPASFKGHEKEFLSDVQKWANVLGAQQQTAVVGSMSMMTGVPFQQAAPAGDTISVAVSVQGTSVTKPEIQDAVEKGVRAAKQNSNRAAKHVLTQVGQKP